MRLKITFLFFSWDHQSPLILAVCLSVCDPHNVTEIYGSADGAL